jgi:hypothetical protein
MIVISALDHAAYVSIARAILIILYTHVEHAHPSRLHFSIANVPIPADFHAGPPQKPINL